MLNKIILLLVLLIPSLCIGGDTFRFEYSIFEEKSEHFVKITSYDDPKGINFSEMFLFKTDQESDSSHNISVMERLRVYLNKENLLSHFPESIQKLRFAKFNLWNEELILNQFLFSGYKVTAFNTENITWGINKIKGFKKTYFFSK